VPEVSTAGAVGAATENRATGRQREPGEMHRSAARNVAHDAGQRTTNINMNNRTNNHMNMHAIKKCNASQFQKQ
jgi:hypothetical protein